MFFGNNMDRELFKSCVQQYANTLTLAMVLSGDMSMEKIEAIETEVMHTASEAYRDYLTKINNKLEKELENK